MPVVLNAANEAAVSMFLDGKIGFTDIPCLIEDVMGKHSANINPTLEHILEVDRWARETVNETAYSRLEGFECKSC